MLNTSEEWKSLWPISSVHAAPLLLSPTTTDEIGPLIFNSSHHHRIFTLPSTSCTPKLKLFSSNPEQFAHNSLQLLRCPGTDSTLALFPTGSNSDKIGFVLLSAGASGLTVNGDYSETQVLSSEDALTDRIAKISVSPLADRIYTSGDSSDSIIGYLLVSTTMSVYYYMIRIRTEYTGNVTPVLELVHSELFQSSIVVHATWSPHIPEESLVLLGNGDLILFDLGCFSRLTTPSQRLTMKKVKISWEKYVDFEKGAWLSCDFSWHPRIMFVVHSSTVFLVDSRSEIYNITPLLKLGTEPSVNDRFLAFSIAGPDRFYFTLASKDMLFLCDIRKPMMPILQWAHNVVNPSYVFVSSLSELRSLSKGFSEAGYGIILGSFWNCEFSLFCYGPKPGSSSFYAWGLPSDISFDTHHCGCGSCLVEEVFYKDQLPIWMNWQQKKDFVLGFGILDKKISSQVFKLDEFGGFTFITLTSSGNLELHRYCASWDYSEEGHVEQAFDLEDIGFYETAEKRYKLSSYVKLKWLNGYLNSDLDRIMSTDFYAEEENETPRKSSLGSEFHEIICKNLKTYSSGGSDSNGTININDVLENVSLPTSIREIALRSMWSNLPKEVLRLGFSTYSDLPNFPANSKNQPLEFLEVPRQQSHLPPFFVRVPSSRSSKWSEKHKPSDHLVGPVTPIPFLIAYRKTLAYNRPADSDTDLECDKVMKVLNEVIRSESQKHSNDQALSEQFSSYKNRAMMDDSGFEDKKHSNLIFRIGDKGVRNPFESDCLARFKFEEKNSSSESEKSFMFLKKRYSMFKELCKATTTM